MLVIEIDSEEIKQSLSDAKTIKIEIPGAINVADAICTHCANKAVDIEQEKLDAIMQAAGYMYDLAVACINEKKDIRKLKAETIITNMMKQFSMTDEQIEADKALNIEQAADVKSEVIEQVG